MDDKVIFSKNKSENPSYWSIKEFPSASDRKQNEFFLELVPHHFLINDLTYRWGVTDQNSWFVDKYDFKNPPEHEAWERLEGNLTSTSGTYYSMFGADQIVEDVKLCIFPGEKFGSRLNVSDNTIMLSVVLLRDEFKQIVDQVQSNIIKEGYLSFVANGGFYSEQSFMDYEPKLIKVLDRDFAEESLIFENEEEKNSPFLNIVRNLDYSFSSRKGLFKDISAHGVGHGWVKEKVDSVIHADAKYYKDDGNGSDEEKTFTINEELEKKLKYSPMAKLLKEMLFEVHTYCVERNFSNEKLEELSNEIIDLVEDMASAFQEERWYDLKNDADALSEFYQRKWNLWKHTHVDFRKIIGGEKRKFVEIFDLKELVSKYLRLPIRSTKFSRILIDAMIYHETASYAETLLYVSPLEKSMLGVEHKILLRGHPMWRFLKSHFMTFIILVVLPISGFWLAVEKFEVREEWPLWVAFGCAGLFALNLALGVISLPYTWISEGKEKKRITKLIEEMVAINTHIGAGEIISARFVLVQLEKTGDKGAVWPSEIFPLLDDIIMRDGII